MRTWHFTASDGKGGAVLRDGRPVVVGEKLIHDEVREEKIALCERGLHSSVRAIDALPYAPGSMVSLCDVSGKVIEGSNKLVSTERTALFLVDAEETLRLFARRQALSVIDKWDASPVVREFLETGNLALRSEACSAAWRTARSAARNAALSAAFSAACSTAWGAAWSAAESAAESAACSTAWSAAESAALSAARSAANEMLEGLLLSLAVEKGWKP